MLPELKGIRTIRQLTEFTHTELGAFFSKEVKIDPAPASILDMKARWQDLGFVEFDPVFFNGARFPSEAKYSGWKRKPNEWFYHQVREAKVAGSPLVLRRGWALVDTSTRPNYRTDGSQTFNDDQFSTIMTDLRVDKKVGIPIDNPDLKLNSRFAISKDDVGEVIYPEIARTLLRVGEGRVTNLKAIEFIFLRNLRYQHFVEGHDTWEFFDDSYSVGPGSGSLTLRGGNGEEGLSSAVDYCSTFNRLSRNCFRPVIFVGAHLAVIK